MKTSDVITAMAHAFSDNEYQRAFTRRLAGKVAMMETVLVEVASDPGCECDDDEGTHCLPCRARAALE